MPSMVSGSARRKSSSLTNRCDGQERGQDETVEHRHAVAEVL